MVGSSTPGHFYFIGVSTGGSSIQEIFPKWMAALNLNATLVGIDLPMQAETSRYREAVQTIKDDDHAIGALVTTHKIDIYRACADLIDDIDPLAATLGEFSCLVKSAGKLHGYALDPAAAEAAMAKFLQAEFWDRHRSDLLCLGAGGAGLAITYVALTREPVSDRPARIIMADIDTGRLELMGHHHDRFKPTMPVHYHRVYTASDNDALVKSLRPYSLIVNATGLGKDRPGSPLSDAVRFPDRSYVWELNYRGERAFLKQAEAQASEKSLKVIDGWDYFVHGWSKVIAQSFGITISDDKLRELADIAANGSSG